MPTAIKTILAIGAHPDDIEFGCGVILLKEAQRGSRIHLLVCSKGEAGSHGSAEERVGESEAAAALLGAELSFLELGGDARIEETKPNAMQLAKAIRKCRPHILLAPSNAENQHPDHRAVGDMARDASRLARYAGLKDIQEEDSHKIESIFHYAITPASEPSVSPSAIIDITDVRDQWIDLMRCHRSQMKTRRYIELQEARSRTWGLQCDFEYGQALYCSDPLISSSLSELPGAARLF